MSATVFGLDVHGGGRLSFLQGARAGPTGRVLALRRRRGDAADGARPRAGRSICVQRAPDRSSLFRIDEQAGAGYRIWGRERGSYLLSGDGERLCCLPGACPAALWQRFLVGQVLPFTALVRGLEVLHASAVVLDGEAVAFAGPSGAGKTSLALELCRHGARFLTDDVLALERSDGLLLAHPGAPLVAIGRDTPGTDPPGAQVISSRPRERIVRLAPAAAPAPMGALFLLDRRPGKAVGPTFEPCARARTLLGTTFNFVLDTPGRLRKLLEVCSVLAGLRVERVTVTPGLDPAELAARVAARLQETS